MYLSVIIDVCACLCQCLYLGPLSAPLLADWKGKPPKASVSDAALSLINEGDTGAVSAAVLMPVK